MFLHSCFLRKNNKGRSLLAISVVVSHNDVVGTPRKPVQKEKLWRLQVSILLRPFPFSFVVLFCENERGGVLDDSFSTAAKGWPNFS